LAVVAALTQPTVYYGLRSGADAEVEERCAARILATATWLRKD
jgi:hypothetical protein